MLSRLLKLAAGIAAAIVTAGCGGTGQPTPCAPLPSPSAQVTSAGQVRAHADTDTIAPGQTVTFALTVLGPASYSDDCNQAVQISISDQTGLSVDTSSGVSPPSGPCGNVTVAAGHEADYTLSWTPDPTLLSGRYTVALLVGDQPAVALIVMVRTRVGGCG